MTNADKLKLYISNRVSNITNDCRVFLWFRHEHPEVLEIKKLRLGGGNLLMAIGLFQALEYLSKIYVSLIAQAVKNRNGSVNVAEAFKRLIKDCPHKLNLESVNEDDLGKFWDRWRNKLAHLLAPKDGTAMAFVPQAGDKTSEQYVKLCNDLLVDQTPVFTKNRSEDWWDCYVDKFVVEVDKIGNWITNTVVNGSQKSNIDAALKQVE